MINNYNDTQTGDIIHRHVPFYWYKPDRYIAAFIRLFTKSWCSHTAMIVDVWGEKMVIENDNSNTRLISFENWAKDSDIVISRIELTDLEKRKLCILSINELGNTGYDYEAIPHHIIYSISGIWIGRTGDNAKSKKVCSEFVAYLYNELKGFYPNWFSATPNVLYEDKRFAEIYFGEAKKLV